MLVVVTGATLLGGCADDGVAGTDADDSGVALHCPGARPAIEDCFTGRDFAECGGTGDPLFACSETSENDSFPLDCRWFVGGCVAQDYLASSCPADDVCCQGDFPFTHEEMDPYPELDASAAWTLYSIGTLPWNRADHMAVGVDVDPSLQAQSTQLTCSGDFGYGEDPCSNGWVGAELGDTLVIEIGRTGMLNQFVAVEIDVAATPQPTARACVFHATDALTPTCPLWDTVDCASSGTLVVNTLDDPQSLYGTVDLVFASGATLSGSFAAE